MPIGAVKWFNDQKGYGFIEPRDGSREVFVHQSDIEMAGWRTLEPGSEVEYELVATDKGPRAKRVRAPAAANGAVAGQANAAG
ncbi:MAG: cold shock domain-containing protein [Armatimonadetes bacterium]|nr:cold shock domain-containing protein [Armatimonadota bacterium]